MSEGESWPDARRTLDTTGQQCPIPIVRTSRTLRDMEIGSLLEVLADDSGIAEDLPAWCQANGQTLVKLEKGEQNNVYHGFVRKETEI